MAAKENRIKFEITPKHPTRKVYDHVLYPDGLSYVKELPASAAISVFKTCTDVKAIYNDQYYPVTPDNVEAATEKILADEAPEGIEPVEAGKHSLASFVVAYDVDEAAFGVKPYQVQDIEIEDGEARGTLYYNTITQFSGDVTEQQGYYVWIDLTTNTEYKNVELDVVNGKTPGVYNTFDNNYLIFLGATPEEANKKIITVKGTRKEVEGAEPEIVYISMKNCKCTTEPAPAVVAEAAPEMGKVASEEQPKVFG